MNDLEMYREQLALCDDRIIDALVERNRHRREDHGLQRRIRHADPAASSGEKAEEKAGGEAYA